MVGRRWEIAVASSGLVALLAAGILSFVRWRHVAPEPAAPQPFMDATGNVLGGPRAGLTKAERAAFFRGQREFTKSYAVADGLGPVFNGHSCFECHDRPTAGGSGDMGHRVVVAPTKLDATIDCVAPLCGRDPENLQRFAIPGFAPPTVPNFTSLRTPPPLFGAGLLEAIPDEYLLAKGCRGGTFHMVKGRVARFGAQTFTPTVRTFVASAAFDEMGITSNVDPEVLASTDKDAVPDPEISVSVVDDLTAFISGLAPPAPLAADPAGEALFVSSFRCADCHRPETGPGVRAYTDLCNHRMGPTLADGVVTHTSPDFPERGDMFRTTPLWGLRYRTRFLHDGRAASLDEAVRLHGGEAAEAAGLYTSATSSARDALLAYLMTL